MLGFSPHFSIDRDVGRCVAWPGQAACFAGDWTQKKILMSHATLECFTMMFTMMFTILQIITTNVM